MNKISKKIVGWKVINEDDKASAIEAKRIESIQKMSESFDRPELLRGSTTKIKTPQSEHALYLTINDVVLNEGTDHEIRRPFELFINTKDVDNFQWVIAFTRVISGVFRKGGDCCFLVDELKAVHDPKGGYFKKGGRFMPSVVAEIGYVLESHLQKIGMIEKEEMSEAQKEFLAEKRKQFNAKSDVAVDSGYPENATVCKKCGEKAVIVMDGCATCLSCGDSKCG